MLNSLPGIRCLDKSTQQVFVWKTIKYILSTPLFPFPSARFPFSFFPAPPLVSQSSGDKKKCCNKKYCLCNTALWSRSETNIKSEVQAVKVSLKHWCAAVKSSMCTSKAPRSTSVWLKDFRCNRLRCLILPQSPTSTRCFMSHLHTISTTSGIFFFTLEAVITKQPCLFKVLVKFYPILFDQNPDVTKGS